jgi:hypothetical protein
MSEQLADRLSGGELEVQLQHRDLGRE